MKNLISCRPGSYRKYANRAYEHLAQIGVKHVEISMPSPENVDRVLSELAKFGLSVASIQAACDVKSGDISESFKTTVETANRLGADRIFVSVHTGGVEKSVIYDRLRKVGDVAAAGGVIVIMETHPDLITNGDIALETMKGVDHPNIRVNFDTANIYYYNEGVDGIEEMKKIVDYIEGVHLKDTNGKPRAWDFPTLGEGIVDFRKVREILNARGFFGPFTIEIEGVQGEDLNEQQTLDRMAKSVQHLRDCGY